MTQYQIHLAVNVNADSEQDVMETAARLEEFLGMHCETATQGIVTEILELDESEDVLVDNLSDLAYNTETV